jgi:hypothetical protein
MDIENEWGKIIFIYDLFNGTVSSSMCVVSNDRMMTGELEQTQKEVLLSYHLPGWTEGIHGMPRSGSQVFQPRFKPTIPRIQALSSSA